MNSGLIKGTLKTLVMNVMEDSGGIHGYGIRKMVDERTGGKVKITEGALYPLLHKLNHEGLVRIKTELQGERERKLYSLSEKGKTELEELNIDLLGFAGVLIQFINSKPSLS